MKILKFCLAMLQSQTSLYKLSANTPICKMKIKCLAIRVIYKKTLVTNLQAHFEQKINHQTIAETQNPNKNQASM